MVPTSGDGVCGAAGCCARADPAARSSAASASAVGRRRDIEESPDERGRQYAALPDRTQCGSGTLNRTIEWTPRSPALDAAAPGRAPARLEGWPGPCFLTGRTGTYRPYGG